MNKIFTIDLEVDAKVTADGKVYVNHIQPAGTVSNIDKPYSKYASALVALENLAAEWKVDVGPGVREKSLALVAPDGSHGRNTLSVYAATPETFKLLGSWSPPHHTTTSYHCKCMVFPVVEGRLFMRGFDGIHCDDLRKKD